MRLFISIKFDDAILDALTAFQRDLKAQGVTGNYTKRENLHLTLAFIGEYDDPDAVMKVIERSAFRPVDLKLDGVGSFKDLFWVGLENNLGLQGYVRRLRRELAADGIGIENKKFLPHITLIRRAAVRGGGMIPAIEPPKGSMRATRVLLMQSYRGKDGMTYTELGSVGGDKDKEDSCQSTGDKDSDCEKRKAVDGGISARCVEKVGVK